MIQTVLGATLKHYRNVKGLSQEKLSSKAHLTIRYYQELEAGEKRPSIYALLNWLRDK